MHTKVDHMTYFASTIAKALDNLKKKVCLF
jgi:hypothetical protein